MTKYLKILNIHCGLKSKLKINKINNKNSIVIIVPGGGYYKLATRETTPIADKFKELDYNTAILYYSVAPATEKKIYKDIDVAFEYLKKQYKNIYLVGFSAGAHLVALLSHRKGKENINAVCLCYPLISLIDKYHEVARSCFLGKQNTDERAIEFSIERQLTDSFPPTFIWTTKDDNVLPYEQTVMMDEALTKNNVIHECIIYPHGPHGMALATEVTAKPNRPEYINKKVAQWPLLADKFFKQFIK